MKFAIIDDNLMEAQLLEQQIQELLRSKNHYETIIDIYTGTDSFLSVWRANAYDVIVMDIFIDGRTGIELAKQIRVTDSEVALIFCSSSNEFAMESYEVNAAYYLTKPATKEKLLQMLTKIRISNHDNQDILCLPDGKKIFPKQIIYSEYYNHVVTIYFKQNVTYDIRISQTELEQLLGIYPYFYSPIRGILINFHEAKLQNDEIFQMSNGKQITIARRKRKEAEDAYMSFRFQSLIKELKE